MKKKRLFFVFVFPVFVKIVIFWVKLVFIRIIDANSVMVTHESHLCVY